MHRSQPAAEDELEWQLGHIMSAIGISMSLLIDSPDTAQLVLAGISRMALAT